MTTEPTLGEVYRRLDEVARQMADLAAQMREDRNTAAATFVRQDVYLAQRQADQAVVADVAGDVLLAREERRADASFRRQVWLALGVAAISNLVAIALALIGLQ